MSTTDALRARELIQAAFRQRPRPSRAFTSLELTADEKASVEAICQLDWNDVSAADWERCSDAVNLLSPEAFCYYLPGLMNASLAENQPHLMAVSAVLFMLDRTPSEDMWNNHFVDRWTLLNAAELEAVEAWIEWLSTIDQLGIDDISLTRALVNLELLKKRLHRK